MTLIERTLLALLVAGVWALALAEFATTSHAQDAVTEQQAPITTIHASEIVGLSAMVQQTVREQQFRPQSMPGLDQYIRSVVRNCRISGSVSGGRLSATNISC